MSDVIYFIEDNTVTVYANGEAFIAEEGHYPNFEEIKKFLQEGKFEKALAALDIPRNRMAQNALSRFKFVR